MLMRLAESHSNKMIQRKQSLVDQFYKRLKELDQQKKLITSLQARFPQVQRFNILSIGCGDEPYEIDALNAFLVSEIAFNYVGIDTNADDIEACRQQYSNHSHVQFQVMDGMQYQEIKSLFEGEIHFVILRHPLLFKHNPATAPIASFFERMIMTTVPYLLTEGGCLVVSLYHPEEKKSFLGLTQFISDDTLLELKENVENFYQKEYVQTPMGEIPRDVYSDRYFFSFTHFKPNLAIKIEKANTIFKEKNPDVKPIVESLAYLHEALYTARAEQRFGLILHYAIEQAIQWRQDHQEIKETMPAALIEMISHHLKAMNVALHTMIQLDRLSFNLLKRKPGLNQMNEKYYFGIANAIVGTVMHNGDIHDCGKALMLIANRPIIESSSKVEEEKNTHRVCDSLPGYGGCW